ncbi:nucleotidyltransferase domain-containing protein [Acidilutibacter cellobiosedens]|jgi:predicted nucleotidyltransferase|uniref:Nucleotidyltransferase domain-containing protein n=1 Tax=Acidilutibacter cellobiosedens TaxID=2507161 RepID=A0A410QCE1_9FIRM|nr:nucleotidyltransferase domain-containing protein [Acidilutibacter cellobiosedens]MBE6083187.1 nucleotidyltransferase domain-containing protein [Tissierellaceae bacterium]QAT61488.1 nucleotidyltransferase domain-containing protein [Acidilutibacter cellobiosedens]
MDIVEKCKNVLMKYENILFAYIFGSYAKGNMRADSDVDIGIYLKEEMNIEEYLKIRMDLTKICKRQVDLVVLNAATPLLKYEIYKNNILLFTRDRTIESNYKVKILFEYNDIKRYLEMSYKKTIERLKNEVDFNG